MSAFDLLLSPFQRSAYVQKLVAERTEHLRHELQVKDEFLRAWGHDIGMPIHGMKAALVLLQDVKDNKDLLYVLELLTTGCQILNDIHTNVWEFLNGYNDQIHSENIELAKWLPPIIDLYRPLAKAKDIQIGLDINNDNALTIVSDKMKLTRVISNLLGNAIKFTPVGKSIFVRTYNKQHLLYIEVQDEGIGIPNDKLTDIFLPYVRLNKKGPGIGIGLSICKKLIEQLQGNITVASILVEGSIFTVIIPVQAAP